MFVLPHADVVLHALCTIANRRNVHPWDIIREHGHIARPALMHWLNQRTASLNYASMREIMLCLTNDHGVRFHTHGYFLPDCGDIVAHQQPPPPFIRFPYHGVTKTNPSAA